MDPMVIEALKAITNRINLSTGLVNDSDRSSTIQLLEILRSSGYALDSILIRNWALQNGWENQYAEDLREVVQGVNQGRRFRYDRTPAWSPNILDILRDRIK